MADQVFDMQPSKDEIVGEEEAGKLFSSTVGGVTWICVSPENAFLVVLSLMAFLVFVLRSGFFDKFKSSSSYAAPAEYFSAYESPSYGPPTYGAPPLEAYGPPGQPFYNSLHEDICNKTIFITLPGYESAFMRLRARVNALEVGRPNCHTFSPQ